MSHVYVADVVPRWCAGLCGVPPGEEVSAPVHIPEEEPQEEDHGLLQQLHGRQVFQ